jgi:hypothetical protein
MQALILHPTESTPVPVTLVATKRPRKARKAQVRQEPTVVDLRQMCKARGLKVTTKHTKRELMAMFATGEYIRPAAYDRAAAQRQAAKA